MRRRLSRKNGCADAAPLPCEAIEAKMRPKDARSVRKVESQFAVSMNSETPAERAIGASQRSRLHVSVKLPAPAAREIRFLNRTQRLNRRERHFLRQKKTP